MGMTRRVIPALTLVFNHFPRQPGLHTGQVGQGQPSVTCTEQQKFLRIADP